MHAVERADSEAAGSSSDRILGLAVGTCPREAGAVDTADLGTTAFSFLQPTAVHTDANLAFFLNLSVHTQQHQLSVTPLILLL